jgi:pyrroline-5-carboxylate reductase
VSILGFIGSGQMATALAHGFVKAKLFRGEELIAFDPYPAALKNFVGQIVGARMAESNAAVVQQADVVILAVKPQQVAAALAAAKPVVTPQKLLVSVAAGMTLQTLCQGWGTERVIRVMPNTPCLVGQGASAFARAAGATADDAKRVQDLLSAVGIACELEEKLLDTVTGLSGSGPAFVYLMIEALADGGVRMGLPRAIAQQLAAQTVQGAASMVLAGEHPAVLKDRVASPAGTTIAGLQALEERAVRGAFIAAVEAATLRSRELGKS